MSDYPIEYDEDDELDIQPPAMSFAYSGTDFGSAIAISQVVRLDQVETLDAHLPILMHKLRNMLLHAGFSQEMVDQFASVERIEALMPKTEVDEFFVDEKINKEIKKGKKGKTNIWEQLPSIGSENSARVQVDRIDLHNFLMTYSRGGKSIQLPKSFFDDLLVAQIESLESGNSLDGEEEELSDTRDSLQ